MTTVHWTDPPAPPGDYPWCVMCLMIAKALINVKNEKLLEQLAADKTPGETRWIPWDTNIRLREGRWRAVSDFPPAGVVDLCWDHVAGWHTQHVSPLANGGQIPPGLLRRRG